MFAVARAIPWAIAMLLVAASKACGLVAPQTAETMFAVLPALAVVSSGRRCACFFGRREASR